LDPTLWAAICRACFAGAKVAAAEMKNSCRNGYFVQIFLEMKAADLV
jgi:hypothetical protein